MGVITATNVITGFWDNTDQGGFNLYTSSGTFTLKPGHFYMGLVCGRAGIFEAFGGAGYTTVTSTWGDTVWTTGQGGAITIGLTYYYHTGATSAAINYSELFGFNATGAGYVLTEFTNVDRYYPIRQTASAQLTTSATSITTNSFALPTRPGNMIVSAAGVQLNEAMTAKSGYTSAAADKANGSLPNTSFINQYKLSPDTDETVTATWTNSNAQAGIVAVELQNANYPRVSIY